MSGDPLDVSGEWTGLYNYPRGLPPNQFAATLRETAGMIAGETTEPSPSHHTGDGGGRAHAFLDGRRNGDAIDFLKHYDAVHRAATPVAYAGTISPDGDEITGRWSIAGDWSGTFLMIRRSRRDTAIERRTAEIVR